MLQSVPIWFSSWLVKPLSTAIFENPYLRKNDIQTYLGIKRLPRKTKFVSSTMFIIETMLWRM